MNETEDFIKELDELKLDFDDEVLKMKLDDFSDLDLKLDFDLSKLEPYDINIDELDELDLDLEKGLESIEPFNVDDIEPIDLSFLDKLEIEL
jgi:hypothetical protein